MAKLEFKKTQIIALLKDSKNIIEFLQKKGVLELTDIKDDLLIKLDATGSVKKFERSIKEAVNALEILEKYTDKKNSVLSLLEGRKKLLQTEFFHKKENTKKTLSVIKKINDSEKKISDLKNAVSKLEVKKDILNPWKMLSLKLDMKETEKTDILIGTLPKESNKDEIYRETLLQNAFIHFETLKSDKKEKTYEVVIFHKEHRQIISDILKKYSFDSFSFQSSLTPEEEISKINEEIKSCQKLTEEAKNEIKKCDEYYGDIEFLIDYYTIRKDKYTEVNKLAMTKSTVIIKGFIPKIYYDEIKAELERKYPVIITARELNEDEEAPVLLSNSKFSYPVEGITEMYALPNKRDVDPSSVMAFFYYLFFGMMLSDAGYGIIMIIATTVVLYKTSVEGALRRSLKMFQYCGISTLFWGILFGSWFGDLPQVIASNFFGKELRTTALWFEPLDDPMKLLLFSFGLGICHLFLGLYVRFKMLYKEGKKFDAFCEVIPIYFTILGAAPLAAGILTPVSDIFKKIGTYFLIAGVIAIVLTSQRSSKNIFLRFFGGIYGLYNVATGYLSDILSYSRLLALGLATGSIASVINLIAAMPKSTALKAIMLIAVGLIGHTANLGINLLGAYVHADRLQFVELFSKFYEGGGKPFTPLKENTKYYNIQ